MRTEEITIYTFQELSEEAQQRALDKARDWNVDHDWWDCTFEDAERIGARIGAFSTDRGRYIDLELKGDLSYTVQSILSEHGKSCDTYELAREYYRRKHIGVPMDVAEFTQQLGECYLQMLDREYDYLTSDESIVEFIKGNEYEFLENGELH